jgi:hypothetical protein
MPMDDYEVEQTGPTATNETRGSFARSSRCRGFITRVLIERKECVPGDFANVENKHTQMYYYIRVNFSCVFPIS